MAISISSDLIAGVLNAAAPASAADSAARLGASDAVSFAANLAEVNSAVPHAGHDVIADVLSAAESSALDAARQRLAPWAQRGEAEPYRKFEAFLLGSALEDILPSAGSGVFGDGFAGGIWRSTAAQQFGSLFADRGGFGIERMLGDAGGREAAEMARSGQWPYFETGAIDLAQG